MDDKTLETFWVRIRESPAWWHLAGVCYRVPDQEEAEGEKNWLQELFPCAFADNWKKLCDLKHFSNLLEVQQNRTEQT